MPQSTSQNYANHTRWDPLFHFFLIPLQALTFLLAIWNLVRNTHLPSVILLLLCGTALLSALKSRLYPLHAQDRVIRLEERLRLLKLLPEDLRPRIEDLTESQLIALRFASDEELPALVAKTLANNWKAREIKAAVVSWRPDYFRV